MAKRKVSKKGTKRRATKGASTRKRKTVRKKSTTRSRKAASSEERQLAVFHNPFSRATKQPKIPDGKITESLGFQTQAVGELQAINADTSVTGNGIMDILMFAGQNCGLLVRGDLQGQYPNLNVAGTPLVNPENRLRAVGYEGSNNVFFNATNNNGGIVQFEDNYSYWRLVSQGLRLSLLNPQEEDDGWWEAVRITEPLDTIDWGILTTDNSGNTLRGAVVPRSALANYGSENYVNQNSYSTGLLRDLNSHVFKLNGLMDHHDFKQQMESIELQDLDIDVETSGAAGTARGFGAGRTDVERLINQMVDNGYDMVYIRIHGRAAGNPSRLHYNIVSNQEVVFPAGEREARFHTTSGAVGNMEEHVSARNSMNNASHMVPM